MEERPAFERIAASFRLNIQATRVFNEQIGPLADEHDQTARREWSESLDQVLPQLREIEGPDVQLVVPGSDEAPEDDAESEEGKKRIFVDPDILYRLMDASERLNRRAPGQGALLRRGALITLLSYFEALISDLIQLYYSMYPARLSKDKTLSLDTLRTIGPTGIGDIEKHLAADEADGAQLDYFAKRLNLSLAFLDPERDLLTEVVQRRNLIVHNQGIVNRQYLSNVADGLIEEYAATEGETLPVTGRYVDAAVDTVYTVGASLIQLCWRKWDKATAERADYEIVHELLYKSLRAERFQLVARIAERLKNIDYDKEKWAKMAIVNRAIALRELGRTREMEQVLSLRDWSASSRDYRLALHALRNEEEELYALLPRAVAAGDVTRRNLEEWPVFAPQRGTERFAKALEDQFGADPSGGSSGDENL